MSSVMSLGKDASGSIVCPPFEVLVSRYPGIKAINDECNRIYPEQQNPLQIQSLVKSWRGGPDPLDYISMFSYGGGYSTSVPPHWHYVSYGLSDLHCDGRLFIPRMFGPDKSGFGFELTFRLKKGIGETSPPVWPAKLMQCLARYVYNYGHPLLAGDHISWHQSVNLDDLNSNTELRQILLAVDPELQRVVTPAGNVDFVQIVPVTTEELLAGQKWSVSAFLDLMRQAPECGGSYLVTEMSRVHSLFQLKPELEQDLFAGVAQDGSDLSGVNALVCSWSPDGWKFYDDTNVHHLKHEYQNLYHQQKGHHFPGNFTPDVDDYRSPPSVESLGSNPSHSDESRGQSSDEAEEPSGYEDEDLAASFTAKCRTGPSNTVQELSSHLPVTERQSERPYVPVLPTSFPSSIFTPNVNYFDLMHITINLEAGFCVPLALTGRLRHGRHFTFKGINSACAITMVSPRVQGSFVNDEKRFGSYGAWLQICMPDSLVDAMVVDFDRLLSTPNVAYPKTFVWPQWSFGLTLVL